MNRVILFDGVCNLCHGFVRFVVRRDPKEKFLFCSLQSETGKNFSKKIAITLQNMQTVILVSDDKFWVKSDAFLEVVRHLRFPWPTLILLQWIPRFFRDFLYDFIAKNRYHWFGKKEKCPLPSPELKRRFLG